MEEMPDVTKSVAAAVLAPLLEAVGFLEWDNYWSKGGGSAFALNLYKCNLAAFAFLFMATFLNNEVYLRSQIAWIHSTNHPRLTAEQERMIFYPPSNGVRTIVDLDQQQHQPLQHTTQQYQLNEKHQIETQNDMLHHPIIGLENVTPVEQQINSGEMRQNQSQSGVETPINHHDMDIPFPNAGLLQEDKVQEQYPTRKLSEDEESPIFTTSRYTLEDSQPFELPSYEHPLSGKQSQIPYLFLSSFLGIIIGDLAELEALRLIGARRVLVVDTIKPFAAAVLGNLLLAEPLYIAAFIGIVFTAVGVYLVLMGSLEKIEMVKQRKRESMKKRRSDMDMILEGIIISDNTSKSKESKASWGYSSETSMEADAEITDILTNKDRNVQMVGMRRRPLSRHDLQAEIEESTADLEADDLMMLLEDGRGIINSTICCNHSGDSSFGSSNDFAVIRSPGLRRRVNSGSSSNSLNLSMGSLEMLDMDLMNAQENFDDDDDYDFFFGAPPEEVKKTDSLYNSEEATDHELISIPLPNSPPTKEKPVKSALRKSRFGQKPDINDNTEGDKKDSYPSYGPGPAAKPIKYSSPEEAKENIRAKSNISSTSSSHPEDFGAIKRSRRKRLGSDSSSASLMSSTSSVVSLNSECGPPIGMYEDRKETKPERIIRLRTGYFLATLNVLLDAYGSFLTKKHGDGLSTWEINLFRMGFAGLFLTFISLFMRYLEYRTRKKHQEKHSKYLGMSPLMPNNSFDSDMKVVAWYKLPRMSVIPWIIVSIGVFFVTFLSPALANYSLFGIPLALSISLTSTTPLYTIPLGILIKGEIPTKRGCLGAAFSVLGVIILCLWGIDRDSLVD